MVVYLLFIFFVGIVLLNLLIAQMNKTYENIEKEVRREYYYTLARVLSRYRKSMGPLPSKRFLTISENCICTVVLCIVYIVSVLHVSQLEETLS